MDIELALISSVIVILLGLFFVVGYLVGSKQINDGIPKTVSLRTYRDLLEKVQELEHQADPTKTQKLRVREQESVGLDEDMLDALRIRAEIDPEAPGTIAIPKDDA